jgi:rhodanese-related sulfurtransferase
MMPVLALVLIFSAGVSAKIMVEGAQPANAKEGAYDVTNFPDDAGNKKIVVIDVRTQEEYDAAHFPGAINIPIASSLENELKNFNTGKPIVFVCAAGKRAGNAYLMVKDKRPEIADKVFFLDAVIQLLSNGDIVIKPN